MSKLKMITVHNNERSTDNCGDDYTMIIRPSERRIERLDRSGHTIARKMLERGVFDNLLDGIKQWMLGAGPDDVTYYGQFKTADEYNAWCASLMCEDHEVRWDVLCEYTDGSFISFVCTDSHSFPAPFYAAAMQQ